MRWRGCESSAAAACWGFSRSRRSPATYGAGEAQTIVENCGNTLILRCCGQRARWHLAVRLAPDRRARGGPPADVPRSRPRGRLFGGRGAPPLDQVSEQHVTEPAVMASELEQLPDLTGYLKTASSGTWLRVAFKP